MYIGVIADNAADRKQLERLLGRANDALCSETGTLCVETFGDYKSLLRTPMKYELVMIDITMAEDYGRTIAEQLKSLPIPGQIAVCHPEGTPFSYQDAIEGILSIQKPILTAPLHQMIRDAHKFHLQTSVPTIEIRAESETHYVPVDKILYAKSQSHLVDVYLDDGTVLSMLGEIDDFYHWVNNYPEFFFAKKDMVLNQNHVLSQTKKEYRMDNGDVIILSRLKGFMSSFL